MQDSARAHLLPFAMTRCWLVRHSEESDSDLLSFRCWRQFLCDHAQVLGAHEASVSLQFVIGHQLQHEFVFKKKLYDFEGAPTVAHPGRPALTLRDGQHLIHGKRSFDVEMYFRIR